MSNYYFKINSKYNDSIRKGVKTHEYRLANEKNRKIKKGDILTLVSLDNFEDYTRVFVDSVEFYANFEDALAGKWQTDFEGLFDTFDDLLAEFNSYYQNIDIEKYGVVVYEIKNIVPNFASATVLVDENIIDTKENISFATDNLLKFFNKKKTRVFVNKEYKNKTDNDVLVDYGVQREILKYHENLEPGKYFTNVLAKYSENEQDNEEKSLLLAVYCGLVGILLTNSDILLEKAKKLYIRSNVLTPEELLMKYEDAYPQNIEYKMLSVKLKSFADINIDDHFFDTLRDDYNGEEFNDWFLKKRAQDEKAYVFELKSKLYGFLYLKQEDLDENYSDIIPKLSRKKRLKVGTFKIESTGFRLGERFLKIIFDTARALKVDEIYVTMFEEKRDEVNALKGLMEQWGFYKHGMKKNGEIVLVKNLENYDGSKDIKYNFPLVKDNMKQYFLPIYSNYHTDLFPDNILNNEDMRLYQKENKAHQYAIEKIYLTGAPQIEAKPGDMVLIYRVGDRKPKSYSSVVTGVAIIEEIIKTENVEQCIEICKNRSIFSPQEIINHYYKYSTVVKLLDYKTFKRKVLLKNLYDYGIVEIGKGPRPFASINREQFKLIYEKGMCINEKKDTNIN